MKLFTFIVCLVLSLGLRMDRLCASEPTEVARFVDFLLEDTERFEEVAFAEVVQAVADCEVLPVDPDHAVDRAMLEAVCEGLDLVMADLQDPEGEVHEIRRINETSRVIEDRLMVALNVVDGLICEIPLNAEGKEQRSGYPDLRLVHEASGRVFYLDPKVHRAGSEGSSLRTFYFEPQLETNKILDDASHLILGVSHGGKVDSHWQFEEWKVVDLLDFKVRLKAEFQASNRDLYRDESILMRSAPSENAQSGME
ncbi:MAG: hypothetical protein AAGC73_00670 [Verrucomicrobiota bacterium]